MSYRELTARTLALLALCALALSSVAGASQAARETAARHLVMISIDGLMPDYYTRPQELGLRVPNLARMAREGAHARAVEGVYPSVTYPSHTTLVTGALPARHGIVHNRLFEPPTEPQTGSWYWFSEAIRTDTLWSSARTKGLKTAAVGWPVTAGADIDFNAPEIWDPSENPRTSARSESMSTPGLIEAARAAGALRAPGGDEQRTSLSEFILSTHKPHLMLIHLVELDAAHHRFGPLAPQALAVAERQDQYLGRILEAARRGGIYGRTAFFIVSDHGFAGVDRRFEPNAVLAREGMIRLDPSGMPVSWQAAAWPSGGSCAIVLHNPAGPDVPARVLETFSKYLGGEAAPLSRIVRRGELDRLGSLPQAFIVLEAAPGISFGDALAGPEMRSSGEDYRGTHGYLPKWTPMGASWVLHGSGIRPRAVLERARMIDVAPTAARLLDVPLRHSQGRWVRDVLR